MGAIPTPIINIATARGRCSPGNSSITTDCATAAKGEQKPDCRTRQKIRASREDDKPHNKVETAKPATPIAMTLRRPNLLDIQPAKGMLTAVAIKFAVTTQAT